MTPTRKTTRQATSAVAFVGMLPASDDPLLAFEPYRHTAPRANSITPARQRAFIAHLAATGVVSQAAMKIGKSVEALYKLRQRPGAEGFAASWDRAVQHGIERLEEAALARAIEGVPVWKATPDGGMISMGAKHNEALVMFMLRNRRPERYAAHIGPGHAVYERIRNEVLGELVREGRGQESEVLALLAEKLDALVDGRAAAGKKDEAGAEDRAGGE